MFLVIGEAGLVPELRQPVAVGERGCTGISKQSCLCVGAMGGKKSGWRLLFLKPVFGNIHIKMCTNSRYTA